MYEKVTYESILQRMLDRVPNNMDKREGAIIYDALAPAAMELFLMYLELDVILKETYADTASRNYLIKRVAERGIEPEPATNAILKGEFTPVNLHIPNGSRFSCENLNYTVIEKISNGQYKLRCETAGEAGNAQFGQMIPIDYINGLETCYLTELLIPGEDEESTESIRKRYFDSFNSQAFGGNVADYKEKTKSIDGVGGVKVNPVWNGGGTVGLIIIDSNYEKPSDTLIDTVQTIIDPEQNQGLGVGLAPIGHVVTVFGCDEFTVNIKTKFTFQEGYTWESLKPSIENAIDEYFKELNSEWESVDNIVIRISQIETRLINLTGVVDVENTTINGVAKNCTIPKYSIPIKGGVVNA